MSATRTDAAMDLFRRDFNCAQEVCGAVAGGVLVLGARHGRGPGDPKNQTEETYARVRCLMANFAAHHGSCACRETLGGCDISSDAGRAQFKAAGYRESRCAVTIRDIVAAIEAIDAG